MPQHESDTQQSTVETPGPDGAAATVHIVRIDYTNGSAQVLNPHGDCVALYGPGVTRNTIDHHLSADGWRLLPDVEWVTTTPPDGREHPVHPPATTPGETMTEPEHPAPLDLHRVPDEDKPGLITARFGPGAVVLGLSAGFPHTTPNSHTSIHRSAVQAATTATGPVALAYCHDLPIRDVLAVTDDPSAPAVITLLSTAGYEPCRMCRRCWSGDLIPEHDQFRCYDRHRLPVNMGRLLSQEAIAVIAGMIAPTDEVHAESIMASDEAWEQIRAAFPIEKFHAWAEAHYDDEDTRFYDPP
jgi:hypothetical protein